MNGLYRKIKEIRKHSDDNWSKMKDVLCRLFRRKSWLNFKSLVLMLVLSFQRIQLVRFSSAV